eukprot:10372947-Karenia_brevis.AAC.1
MLAAVAWGFPRRNFQLTSTLPRSRRALKGFLKLGPNHSRLPLPYPVVCGLAMQILAMGHQIPALLIMIGFHMYLRPREMIHLKWKQWSRPMPRQLGGAVGWALTLHAAEDGIQSKVGDTDETVIIDHPEFAYLNQVIEILYNKERAKGNLDLAMLPAG